MRTHAWIIGVMMLSAQMAWASGRSMNVQVRETVMRDRPSFMGAVTGGLAYGDQVSVFQEQGAWSRVRLGASEGWVHTSSLTRKAIERPVGGAMLDGAASSSEVALAGKGFNQQVEDEFKKQNRQLDFTTVDRMEKMAVSETEIRAFLVEGGLQAGGVL